MDLIFVLQTQLINLTFFDLDFEHPDGGGRRLLPRLSPGKTGFAKQVPLLHRLNGSNRSWKFRVLVNGEFTGIEMDPQVVMNYVRIVFNVEGGVLCFKGIHERPADAIFRLRYFGCMRNFFWDRREQPELIYPPHTQIATNLRNEECRYQHLPPYVDRNEEEGGEGASSTSEAEAEAEENVRSSASDSPAGANSIIVWDSLQERRRNVNSHLDPPIKSRGRIGIDHNVHNINARRRRPRPRPRRYNGVPARRARRPRPIDDEPSSANVVDHKDSFVHTMLFVFALIVFIRLRFF